MSTWFKQMQYMYLNVLDCDIVGVIVVTYSVAYSVLGQ
jgi:hypothetical protein